MNQDISLTAEMLECNKRIQQARREERKRCAEKLKQLTMLEDVNSMRVHIRLAIKALEDET